ncbi:hypothetical protein, partial [Ralstonia solanacearum]|uniref:hypothetical protein n=1 Tax=Ralstonia solanacearum TaxID=305 RepID=UPI001E359E7B
MTDPQTIGGVVPGWQQAARQQPSKIRVQPASDIRTPIICCRTVRSPNGIFYFWRAVSEDDYRNNHAR